MTRQQALELAVKIMQKENDRQRVLADTEGFSRYESLHIMDSFIGAWQDTCEAIKIIQAWITEVNG
jgi:hypothetical protein